MHIWHASLSAGAADLASPPGALSPDERARAERIQAPADRRRWVAGRGILRQVLAGYLAIAPSAIAFRYSAHGKPALAHVSGDLRFNLSHTADHMLIAVSRGRELGIDIEPTEPDFDFQPIVSQLFAEGERAALAELPPHQRGAAFMRIWTCKEAFVKACGFGLALPLRAIEIAASPGQPAHLRRLPEQLEAARWCLREIEAGAGRRAALVAAGADWRVREYAVR